MPTYVLESNTPTRISAGPVRLQIHASDVTGPVSLTASTDGAATPGTLARPGVILIPRLTGLTGVSASPQTTHAFPDGSVIDVTIDIEGPPSADPERIVLKLDVSGLSERQLVTLEPKDGSIVVFHRGGGDGGKALTGLAKAAQIAAREVLGVETVDPTSSIHSVIVIDGSASMLGSTKDGNVRALVDVLIGVSAVVGPGRSVAAAIVGESVSWVASSSVETLGEDVERAQAETALSIGFRSAHSDLVGKRPNENTVTWLLTDSLPSDLDDLRRADEIQGEARHLVLFADAQAVHLQGDARVPSTLVPPVAGEEGLTGRLEIDSAALRRTIKSLLAGCFVPGTDYAKRVAS
jgi:hypothetical protein